MWQTLGSRTHGLDWNTVRRNKFVRTQEYAYGLRDLVPATVADYAFRGP